MTSWRPLAWIAGLIAATVAPVPPPQTDATFVVRGPSAALERPVVWRQQPDREADLVAARVTVPAASEGTTLVVPCVAGDYVVQTSTHVSRPFHLDADQCSDPRDVALFPSATVRGQIVLTAAGSAAPPAAASQAAQLVVAIDVFECQGSQLLSARTATHRVRASNDSRFEVAMPAGCVSLLVRVGSFAPVPALRLALKAGESADLGSLAMKPGATLIAGIRMKQARVPGALAWVVPVEDYEGALSSLERRNNTLQSETASADRSGVAAFVGVPPGLAHLLALCAGGLGTAGPIELVEGDAVELEDVELRAEASVDFDIVGDRSWIKERLQVAAIASGSELGIASDSTRVSATELDGTPRKLPWPGRWQFELRAGELVVDRQSADVAAEGTTTVRLSVERSLYRGRVLAGDLPVAGSLVLAREGSSDTVAQVETDADGQFEVLLREPGVYSVECSSPPAGISHARATATFAPGRETTVRLATQTISGTVVFADGRPAAKATVTAARVGDEAPNEATAYARHAPAATTGANGSFAFRALNPGSYDLTARAGTRTSEPKRVAMDENRDRPVTLQLPELDGLVVWVTNAKGEGVPLVHGWVMAPTSGPNPQTATFQTDDDGGAKVGVSWPPGGAVQIVVTDSAHPAAAFLATPNAEGVVSLALPSTYGQLRISRQPAAGEPEPAFDPNTLALVSDRGGVLPLGLLSEMGVATVSTLRNASTLVVPALASGAWRLVRFPDVRAMLQSFGGSAASEQIRSFSLAPGSVVVIDLR